MKDVFKAINKQNWFLKINLYLIIVIGFIGYIAFVVSFIIALFGLLTI